MNHGAEGARLIDGGDGLDELIREVRRVAVEEADPFELWDGCVQAGRQALTST